MIELEQWWHSVPDVEKPALFTLLGIFSSIGLFCVGISVGKLIIIL